MKVQLIADVHIDGTEALAAQVSPTVEQARVRHDQRITWAEAHLSDENAGKSGQQDQRCMREARLEGRQPLAPTEHAATMQQAVHGAAQKVARLLDTKFGRLHDDRGKSPDRPSSVPEPARR